MHNYYYYSSVLAAPLLPLQWIRNSNGGSESWPLCIRSIVHRTGGKGGQQQLAARLFQLRNAASSVPPLFSVCVCGSTC